LRSKR